MNKNANGARVYIAFVQQVLVYCFARAEKVVVSKMKGPKMPFLKKSQRIPLPGDSSEISDIEEEEDYHADFYPVKDAAWMGRDIETLILGHLSRTPGLQDELD